MLDTIEETSIEECDQDTPEKYAENGAIFLDEVHPGWANEINIETLAIQNPCNCILGQLYGNYNKGKREIGIGESRRAIHLGFAHCLYDRINDAWKREISSRI